MQKNSILNKLIRVTVCIVAPLAIAVVLMLIGALIILNTDIPNTLTSIFMIIAVAIGSIVMSVLFASCFKIKNIYCAVISFSLITLIRVIITLALCGKLVFGVQGIVGIIFTAIFCFIGALLAGNIKK